MFIWSVRKVSILLYYKFPWVFSFIILCSAMILRKHALSRVVRCHEVLLSWSKFSLIYAGFSFYRQASLEISEIVLQKWPLLQSSVGIVLLVINISRFHNVAKMNNRSSFGDMNFFLVCPLVSFDLEFDHLDWWSRFVFGFECFVFFGWKTSSHEFEVLYREIWIIISGCFKWWKFMQIGNNRILLLCIFFRCWLFNCLL